MDKKQVIAKGDMMDAIKTLWCDFAKPERWESEGKVYAERFLCALGEEFSVEDMSLHAKEESGKYARVGGNKNANMDDGYSFFVYFIYSIYQ